MQMKLAINYSLLFNVKKYTLAECSKSELGIGKEFLLLWPKIVQQPHRKTQTSEIRLF